MVEDLRNQNDKNPNRRYELLPPQEPSMASHCRMLSVDHNWQSRALSLIIKKKNPFIKCQIFGQYNLFSFSLFLTWIGLYLHMDTGHRKKPTSKVHCLFAKKKKVHCRCIMYQLINLHKNCCTCTTY